MRSPDLPMVSPSHAQLFQEGCFAQRSMISGSDLRKAALQRGFYLPLFPRRDVLEPLDQLGGFRPIGFQLTNFTPETTWLNPDPAQVAWREEHGFRDWEEHGWYFREDDHVHVNERYSPWQLLYLNTAVELFDLRRPDKFVLDEQQASWAERGLIELDEGWSNVIKLLIALQPRLWPFRRQRTTLLNDPALVEPVNQLERAVATFDAKEVLRRFELTRDDVAVLHSCFADAARQIDPTPRWFRLIEAAPRKVTDTFKGEALRARDLSDAAYLLRGFYFLATNRWLPREDELDDGQVDYRRRHLPRTAMDETWRRLDLKPLLTAEGLYPHRIHFFVEGATEQIVLGRLLSFLGYSEGSGFRVTDIQGVDKALRHQVIFRAATEVAARTVLIADREGTLSKTLAQLQADGLFANDEDVLLWENEHGSVDFEEANFTDTEIVAAIRSASRKRAPDFRVDLSVSDVRKERAGRTLPRRSPPALTKLALKMAEDAGARVSKKELAVVLGDKLVSDIRRAGHLADAGKQRPLLRRLWFWIANER